jgi:hypothetical protein
MNPEADVAPMVIAVKAEILEPCRIVRQAPDRQLVFQEMLIIALPCCERLSKASIMPKTASHSSSCDYRNVRTCNRWRTQMTATARRHRRDRSHIALVTSREELIYLLSACLRIGARAGMRLSLFGVFTQERRLGGGLTPAQAEMVRRWKRRLSSVP